MSHCEEDDILIGEWQDMSAVKDDSQISGQNDQEKDGVIDLSWGHN